MRALHSAPFHEAVFIMAILPPFYDGMMPFSTPVFGLEKTMNKPKVEAVIHAPVSWRLIHLWWMNDTWVFYCGRRSTLYVETKVEQSLHERADVIDIASIDQYLVLFLPSPLGVVSSSLQLKRAMWPVLTKGIWAEVATVCSWLKQKKAHGEVSSLYFATTKASEGHLLSTWA